jgi:UDP-N-acetylmuramyl pentapeptide phosphotransferase/UDP-N-acetylglucosamine-1-phosphate transferase
MVATLSAWAFLNSSELMVLALSVIFLMGLSLVDDLRGLSAGFRFMGHFVVAGFYIGTVLSGTPPWAILLLAVAIVWFTNLYNFMDGSDGLAGGMAVFGFATYAVMALATGNVTLSMLSLAVASSSCGFLVYNFHPARIFMGDAGSIPIGFLSVAIGLLGWQQHAWPIWFPVLVFSPFIVDATVTLLKRLFRGEKIWEAHRSHYYQRLVQMGWGHRNTALAEYGLMLAVGSSAIFLTHASVMGQWMGLAVWCLIYSVLMFWVDRRWQAKNTHIAI